MSSLEAEIFLESFIKKLGIIGLVIMISIIIGGIIVEKYYVKDDECGEKTGEIVFKSPEAKRKTFKIYNIISGPVIMFIGFLFMVLLISVFSLLKDIFL